MISFHILNEDLFFPDVQKTHKSGILALGGDLSIERLILSYKNGIFPWFNEDEIIQWYCPDPRFVLYPYDIKISKSMKKIIERNEFLWTENKNFEDVIINCSKIKRNNQIGTWITNEMIDSYIQLNKIGFAKSIEVWKNNELVGGFYGIDLGHIFCGESMFSKISNASKFGFISFVNNYKDKYNLIDCQVYTEHLASLGAKNIEREQFLKILKY